MKEDSKKAKPNKANIRKWVKALRSGKYEQATGRLREEQTGGGYKYCCLGVASDLCYKERHMKWQGRGTLPEIVQKWLGIDNSNPELVCRVGDARRQSAVDLNDSYKKDFEFIAAAIERTYLK